MAQLQRLLPRKCEALSSNPVLPKNKQQECVHDFHCHQGHIQAPKGSFSVTFRLALFQSGFAKHCPLVTDSAVTSGEAFLTPQLGFGTCTPGVCHSALSITSLSWPPRPAPCEEEVCGSDTWVTSTCSSPCLAMRAFSAVEFKG
jgi:hypothetical protein